MTQKQQLTTFFYNWSDDRYDHRDNNSTSWLRTHSPLFDDIVTSWGTTCETSFKNLKPETRSQLEAWEKEFLVFCDEKLEASNVPLLEKQQLIRDFIRSVMKQMTEEVREDLKKQFPWVMSVVDGHGLKVFIVFWEIFTV